MNKFRTINQVLNFAVKKEQTAYRFYRKLAAVQKTPHIKTLFLTFAAQEKVHKKKLKETKKKDFIFFEGESSARLTREEYSLKVRQTDVLDYRQALLLALQQEKEAFRLYTELAAAIKQDGIKALFGMLAKEEAEHKLRLELEYEKKWSF